MPAAPGAGLLRLAWRLAGPTDAEDLVQATYVRALEHDASVRRRPAWWRAVLRNEQWMALRTRKRRDAREREVEPTHDADVDHVVHQLQLARLVQRLVDALEDDVRLVIRERYFEGRTCAEIARIYSIPAGTVRWRLKVGLDRLRADLDAEHGGERLLWAGALIGPSLPPTLGEAAASTPTNAGAESAAAAKGSSGMSMIGMKLVLGATALGTVGVTAAVVGTRGDAAPATVASSSTEPGRAAAVAAGARTQDPGPAPDAGKAKAAAWARRLAQIRAAHGAAPEARATAARVGSPAVHHGLGACTGEGCVDAMVEEVLAMVDGCNEFMSAAPPQATLEAKVVGAPDVGVIVESVAFVGGAEIPADLRECLTKSMYALDLGSTDQNLEETLTLVLGTTANVDLLAGAAIDPQARAQVEAAIADAASNGKSGEFRMILRSRPDEPPH
jgi:RNA polymerase sigma-70 factor (ECF subfamily)